MLETVKSPAFWVATLVIVTAAGLLFVRVMGLKLCRLLKVIEAPSATVPKSMGLEEALRPPATTFPVRLVVVELETPFPRLAVTDTVAL